VTPVVDQLLTLLQIRDANRNLVLQQYVEPLKAQIDQMQARYIDAFHGYRSQIRKAGITEGLRESVACDLDHMLATRAEVCASLSGMTFTAESKLDRHIVTIGLFADAVTKYLALKDMDDVTYSAAMTAVLSRRNCSYHLFDVTVENSIQGRTALIEMTQQIIDQLQARYRDVLEVYADTKSTLLTGSKKTT
jgi:hypothetical protein